MVLKIAGMVLIGVVILIIVALLVLYAGSALSLDRSLSYTRQASDLPLIDSFSAQTDGVQLVRIPAGGFEFRARVAGDPQSDQVVILLHGFPVTSANTVGVTLSTISYRPNSFSFFVDLASSAAFIFSSSALGSDKV